MNEFIAQFLIESREFVEQATEGLLVLEHSPQDAEKLDSVFRAFHTLKGGAGIVEFELMERRVHAAEEILSAARAGKRALTPALVGECLACLDQVLQWLDDLERTGEFPSADEEPAGTGWLDEMLEANPAVRARVATAIRFTPDADCFYQGEDPLARMTTLPDLLSLDVKPVNPWPPLEDLDTYKCNLVITALTAAPASEVTAHLSGHSGTCEIRTIESALTTPDDRELTLVARDILDAQLALLTHATPANFAGFVLSAGIAAENVLRACARERDAVIVAQAATNSAAQGSWSPLRDAITALLSTTPAAVIEAAAPSAKPEAAAQTLRIEAARVDALVRLTGELTVAKNAGAHIAKLAADEGNPLAAVLKERHVVLSRLIDELQGSVLAMRVLPLRFVLQRFPRVIREISANLGKPVKLAIEGEDTEADKAIVEMLFEPLMHIVRNAIDHGIESGGERAARGKAATATIRILAARQGGQVMLEVSDDGGGIDLDRVREVAKARGVATTEELAAMSEADTIDLVFAPGFSTAAKVTELSGRGVGMDAVRSAVAKIGGRVSIESRAHLGTAVRFALPFSVMMTQVMTVEAGGQMFGVPLDAIVETVSLPGSAIAGIGAARAIVLRNRTIPVFDLAKLLALRETIRDDSDATIVITAFSGHIGGLLVDRIGERLDVMLKPLDGLLAGMTGITGTTLLGDGRVLLVLDIGELLQ